MNLQTDIRKVIILVANTLPPKGSGYQKVLEIKISLTGGMQKSVRLILFRPRNYMLVSYKINKNFIDILNDKNFTITSNHDSTWRYDGFDFLKNFCSKSTKIEIISFNILEIEQPEINTDEELFSFTEK